MRRIGVAGHAASHSFGAQYRWRIALAMVLGLLVVPGLAVASPPTTAIRYFYDADGQLKAVYSPSSETGIYSWDPAGNLTSLAVQLSTKLTVIQIIPAQAAVGETVTIQGTGFSTTASSNTVRFHETLATVSAATATSLTVKVPAGATSGPVTVSTPTEGPVNSPQSFIVAASPAPHVSSISSSLAEVGSTLTISGTNFETSITNEVVEINRTRPEIISTTPTTIQVKVPSATTGGHVYVATRRGSSTGPDLYIPPLGTTAAEVSTTQRFTVASAFTMSFSTAKKVGLAIFDGLAGQRVSLVGSQSTIGSANVIVYGPTGAQLSSQTFYGESGMIEPVNLPTTGTYTILLKPEHTGSVKFTSYSVQDATGTLKATTAGEKIQVTLATPGQNARYALAATAGEEVSVLTTGSTFSGFYQLEWLRPDGSVLAASGFNGNGFLEKVKLPTAGTYTLVVNPSGSVTGAVTLTAYNAADATGTITPSEAGESKPFTTTVPGQNVRITFSGTAGQRISMLTSQTTIKTGQIAVYNPEGGWLGGNSFREGAESMIEPITLPTTGTYTAVLDPTETYTGSITLAAYVVQDLTGTIAPTTSGASQAVTVKTPGQNARYSVAIAAGEEVSLLTTNTAFSGYTESYYLEWYNPEGVRVAAQGLRGNGFMDKVKFTTAGAYTLVVNPEAQIVGSTTLTAYIAADVNGTITPSEAGEAKTSTTTIPGQNVRVTFSGSAGQRVSLVASKSSYPYGYVTLEGPEGAHLAEQSFNQESWMIEPTTLPKTGTYTITINPSEAFTGQVTLTAYLVQDITGTLSPTKAGASQSPTLKTPGQNALYSVTVAAGAEVSLKTSATTITGPFNEGGYQLEWLNPEGAWVTRQGFRGNGFLDTYTFPSAGVYTMVVNPEGPNTGTTTVTTYDASAMTGAITPTLAGESKAFTTSVPGQNIKVTFSGTSGQKVSVGLSESAYQSAWCTIYNPDGSQLGTSTAFGTGSGTVGTVGPVTLPSTGSYSILVDPAGEITGGVTLTATLGSGSSPIRTSQVAATVTHHPGRDLLRVLAPPSVNPASSAPRPPRRGIPSKPQAVKAAQTMRRGRPRSRNARPGGMQIAPAAETFQFHPGNGWTPPVGDGDGLGWQTQQPESPWRTVPALHAGDTATALAGQALKLNGLPLEGLTVGIEGTDTEARTDRAGRFLLTSIPAGHQVLVVSSLSLKHGRERYGTFEVGVDVVAHQTTTLGFTLWMTAIDPAGDQTIASPTRRLTTVTTPRIPGLEVRLPAGTVIHDAAGQIVRKLNITPVPVDRPPFPLPQFVSVPLYFTVQPGRAYLSKGAQIIYPNYTHLAAGQRVAFWNYDASGRGWYVYGHGSVTHNGKQVIPDPGVRVWEFTGSMISGNPEPPANAPPPDGGPTSGDPVDLKTGLFTYHKTDLILPDVIPIAIEHTYRQGDINSYSFGIGTTSNYDIRLWTPNENQEAFLILPDGARVRYVGSPSTGYTATEAPGIYYSSKLTERSVGGWSITLTNGTTYMFGDFNTGLLGIQNRHGQQLTIAREENGHITQITTPHGLWVKVSYDTNSRITQITDDMGRVLKYAYTNGRLESATDAMGRKTSYEYDTASNLTGVTDGRGKKYVETTYDTNDRVSKQTLGDKGEYTFSYTLNGSGKVESTTVTDPLSHQRKIAFNEAGYPVSDTEALGTTNQQSTTYERQAQTNLVLSTTDPRGRKTAYKYDGSGNIIERTLLAGTSSAQTTTYSYEPGSTSLTTETDALKHSTTYHYGPADELLSSADPLGHETTFHYDGEGEITEVTNALKKTTTFAYSVGMLATATDPLGRKTKQFIDAGGRVASTTTPSGATTTYEYGGDNEVTKTTDPLGNSTSYVYDADGNLTTVIDPRSNTTKATYDAMDRLESVTDPLSLTTTMKYDAAGNVAELTDRRGKVTTYSYDQLNRPTLISFGVAGSNADSTIKYSYDSGNRLTSVIDSANGTYTPVYDELDRLESLATPTGSIKYAYDPANRRSSATIAGQEPVKYTYDEANRLLSVAQATQTATYGYDSAGEHTTTTLPGGIEERYTYDADGEPTLITYKTSTKTLGEIDYSYEPSGALEAMWGSYARSATPGAVASATYDAANEQISVNGTTFSYDADGNLTSDGSKTYTWNARGQLTAISGGEAGAFEYDPFGRLTRRTNGSATTHLMYDGAVPAQETPGEGTAVNLMASLGGGLVARKSGSTTECYMTDGRGSTIAMASCAGTVSTSYTYDPFGMTMTTGGATGNPFAFQGHEIAYVGLYKTGAGGTKAGSGRSVSPTSSPSSGPARSPSSTPSGGGGRSNPYALMGNNPTPTASPGPFSSVPLPNPVQPNLGPSQSGGNDSPISASDGAVPEPDPVSPTGSGERPGGGPTAPPGVAPTAGPGATLGSDLPIFKGPGSPLAPADATSVRPYGGPGPLPACLWGIASADTGLHAALVALSIAVASEIPAFILPAVVECGIGILEGGAP